MVINPGTSLSAIEYVLDVVDLVLIMSVNPGFGGQKFIPSQIRKIRALKAMCDELGVNPWIEVDGGIVPENAYRVIEAGANALVSGSGVFKSSDYAQGSGFILVVIHLIVDSQFEACSFRFGLIPPFSLSIT